MKILGLWVSKYFSGSNDERFVRPLEALGHEVKVVALEDAGVEARLLKAISSFNPDVILHVPYPGTVRLEVLRAISFESPIVTICWNGDDEWAFADSNMKNVETSKAHNWVVTTDETAVKKYRDAGITRLILKSWGFSGKDWTKKKTKKDIDFYFCGQKTPLRDHYLRALKDAGHNVLIHGAGYSNPIPLDEMIQNYRRAKIGLNFTGGDKNGFVYHQVKARNFEIAAVGTFQLTEWAPGLARLFNNGTNIECFKDTRDLLKKAAKFIKDDDYRAGIAERGYLKARQYSYETIFKDILEKTRVRKIE